MVTDILVTVSPKTANLYTGGSQTFNAIVTGGYGNTAVIWTASRGTITQAGVYTAPTAAGTYTIRATSVEDSTKFDTATVTVIAVGVTITNPPKGLITGETAAFQANVIGLNNTAVTWSASAGTINATTGAFTAPATAQTVTITATSVEMPTLKAEAQVKISSADFDGNSKTNPQLLDLANAFGSTAQANLNKYDLNNDGKIDDEDLKILFRAMGW